MLEPGSLEAWERVWLTTGPISRTVSGIAMPPFVPHEAPRPQGSGYFATTQWGIVLGARAESADRGWDAMEKLCRIYWYPVYCYILWKGHSAHDAQELTQEFFARHLAKNFLRNVDQAKGKFRTFLLTLVNHFLINEHESARTQKRGGDFVFISLEEEFEQGRHFSEPMSDLTPEEAFDQRWALTVFEQALKRVQAEFEAAGKGEQFQTIRPFLDNDSPTGGYETAGVKLGMRPGAVAVAVHRLRQRFSAAIKAEVSETVADPGDVEKETRHLLQALAR